MADFLKSLKVKGVEIDTASATTNQVLQYNGTKFAPATVSGGGSSAQTVSTITGNTTLTNSVVGNFVRVTASSTITIATSTSFSTGESVTLMRDTSGAVSLAAGAGVTINSTPGLNLRAQNAVATLLCTASNTYVFFGDLA